METPGWYAPALGTVRPQGVATYKETIFSLRRPGASPVLALSLSRNATLSGTKWKIRCPLISLCILKLSGSQALPGYGAVFELLRFRSRVPFPYFMCARFTTSYPFRYVTLLYKSFVHLMIIAVIVIIREENESVLKRILIFTSARACFRFRCIPITRVSFYICYVLSDTNPILICVLFSWSIKYKHRWYMSWLENLYPWIV